MRQRVLLLRSSEGVGIDVALGALPFVVLKAFAGRPQDWIDLESVLVRQRRTLDWRLIVEELKPLPDWRETPEPLQKLQQLRSKVEKGA